MHSIQVTRWPGATTNMLQIGSGLPEEGSSALDSSGAHTLGEHAQVLQQQHGPAQLLLVLRDGMLFSLLWQSCFRGSNAGP